MAAMSTSSSSLLRASQVCGGGSGESNAARLRAREETGTPKELTRISAWPSLYRNTQKSAAPRAARAFASSSSAVKPALRRWTLRAVEVSLHIDMLERDLIALDD